MPRQLSLGTLCSLGNPFQQGNNLHAHTLNYLPMIPSFPHTSYKCLDFLKTGVRYKLYKKNYLSSFSYKYVRCQILPETYLSLTSFLAQMSNFMSLGTKNKEILISNLFPYFNICTSKVPIRRQPFIANFMLLVPLASIPAVLINV